MAQIQQTAMDDSAIASVEANGFYQTPNSMAIKAIRSKLTAADWALWSYLQMVDPFGDKMIELPKIPEIAEVIGVSFRQIKRSLSRLEPTFRTLTVTSSWVLKKNQINSL